MAIDLRFEDEAFGLLYDAKSDVAIPGKVLVILTCDDKGSSLSLGDLTHGIQINIDASKLMSFLIRNL